MVEVFIIRLHGRALSERLMWPIGVVEALEFGQLDVQGAVVELVELVAVDRVGALHAAVMLGAFGRQHEQFDAALLAGGLEPGRGLAAAAGMNRPDVERCLADQVVKESCGAGGAGAYQGAGSARRGPRAVRIQCKNRLTSMKAGGNSFDSNDLRVQEKQIAV